MKMIFLFGFGCFEEKLACQSLLEAVCQNGQAVAWPVAGIPQHEEYSFLNLRL